MEWTTEGRGALSSLDSGFPARLSSPVDHSATHPSPPPDPCSVDHISQWPTPSLFSRSGLPRDQGSWLLAGTQ